MSILIPRSALEPLLLDTISVVGGEQGRRCGFGPASAANGRIAQGEDQRRPQADYIALVALTSNGVDINPMAINEDDLADITHDGLTRRLRVVSVVIQDRYSLAQQVGLVNL